jgi:hypothetical protein
LGLSQPSVQHREDLLDDVAFEAWKRTYYNRAIADEHLGDTRPPTPTT